MNKPDLVEKIAADYEFTRVLAREVVDTILQTISETIQSGEEVALAGFGKFKLVERAARVGRNPQTGEPVKIAASKRVKFEQAKAMRELVNIKKRGRKKAK
jgi:DNA-binding protein HU-beta